MTQEFNGDLIIVANDERIPLLRPLMIVGRRESCDICLRFSNVSGAHCELAFKDGRWNIRDLGSTNGLKVNGVRVYKITLAPKDTITIANRGFIIDYVPGNDNPPAGVTAPLPSPQPHDECAVALKEPPLVDVESWNKGSALRARFV
jgi:pSer/pThr/pTyr-binding forkhead associated (FHA) protein